MIRTRALTNDPRYYFIIIPTQKRQLRRSAKRPGVVASKSVDIGVGASIAVAMAAGCANVALTNPIWEVQTQMQASSSGMVQSR